MIERMTKFALILTIFIGVTNAAQKTLPEDGTLGELAWKTLLSSRQTRPDQQHDSPLPARRITTKSLFIAPQIGLDSVPDCPDGHRVNTKGDCIKVINLDQTAHLEFLLQRLNSQYATEDVKEGSFDYDIEEVPENAGPVQLNIPLPLQMNGPRPEDTEGSLNAFVLSKKEVRNPSEALIETENKNGISYPEIFPNDVRKQLFLSELPPIPQESTMENHTEPEVPNIIEMVEDKNMTILNSLEANKMVTNISEELALESELELLQLHKNEEHDKINHLDNTNIDTELNTNASNPIDKNDEFITNIHLINVVENINKTDEINHFERPISPQLNEEAKKDDAVDENPKIQLESNVKIKNSEDDPKINHKEESGEMIIKNEPIQKIVKIQVKLENDPESMQTESVEKLHDIINSTESNLDAINVKQNTSASNVTEAVGFGNNVNKNFSNEIPKITPTNVSLIDLIVGDVNVKLDNKIKKISRIANVKTNDDVNVPQINIDEKSDVEPNSDSVPEASVPVVSNYVQPKKEVLDAMEPNNYVVKPLIHNNFLDGDTLKRQPYWWLPPEWEVRPSKDRNQLMNFWSRLPLVTDPSFNYPYIRRPQRHYIPYQHSLYPHPPFPNPAANFERPIINYRMARHYPRSIGTPFYWQSNLKQWDNTRERIQR